MKKIFLLFVLFLIAFTFYGCECRTHEFREGYEIIKNTTCTQNGITRRYCKYCDYYKDDIEYKNGHQFNEEEIIKNSTCTEDGSAIYKCSTCGVLEERIIPAGHTMANNKCKVCGLMKSDKEPDSWYHSESLDIFHCQNVELHRVVPMSKGTSFLATYYPVCKNCHICGTMKMSAVGPNTPVTEMYLCNHCNEITYVKLKIEY